MLVLFAALALLTTRLPASDRWEDDSTPPPSATVIIGFPGPRFDQALIYPVTEDQRAVAIQRLEEQPAIALDQQEVASLVGSVPDVDAKLPEMILAAEKKADWLEQESRRFQHGEGILQQAVQLRNLTSYARSGIGNFKPYLVRAVVKYEGTGAFSASIADNELWMFNGCLGYDVPPSTRLPVVIFLTRKPKVVHARADVIGR